LTPPAATIQQFQNFKIDLGITHSVLTHGLSYGDDCASLKAFIPRLGSQATSAIAVIEPGSTTDEEMLSLDAAGTRGVRVNLYRYQAMDDVPRQKAVLLAHLERIKRLSLSWSITMTTTKATAWEELEFFIESNIASSGIPMVTDHFALLKASSSLPALYASDPSQQPGFQAVMRLVQKGHLWVKLSAPYRVSEQSDYADVQLLVRSFVDANKNRVLWGSDWPHTPRMRVRSHEEAMAETPFLDIDDRAWLSSLRKWLSDEEWHLLMVQNPQRLFSKLDK
jgi:predicted TIM-barrel fold metal-dependent hydrolase